MKVYVCYDSGAERYAFTEEDMALDWLKTVLNEISIEDPDFEVEDLDDWEPDEVRELASDYDLWYTELEVFGLPVENLQPVMTEEQTFVPKPVGKIIRHI